MLTPCCNAKFTHARHSVGCLQCDDINDTKSDPDLGVSLPGSLLETPYLIFQDMEEFVLGIFACTLCDTLGCVPYKELSTVLQALSDKEPIETRKDAQAKLVDMVNGKEILRCLCGFARKCFGTCSLNEEHHMPASIRQVLNRQGFRRASFRKESGNRINLHIPRYCTYERMLLGSG